MTTSATFQEPDPERFSERASSGKDVWPLLLEDLKEKQPAGPVLDSLMVDLSERVAFGRSKYGTVLRTHNGRRSLVDAYQEAWDGSLYLRQALEEGVAVHGLYAMQLAVLIGIRAQLTIAGIK